MYELSQIILWILWTLRPAMAVETNLIDIINSGFALFRDDETIASMSESPEHCAIVAAALGDAHAKLDLLIYLRACEIAGIRAGGRGFIANRHATGSRLTPQTCWSSFRGLLMRFDDRERLTHLRAERLRREAARPLRLDAPHQASTLRVDPAALRAVEASLRTRIIVRISSSAKRGRWIARACAQDGGGSHSSARGPPPSIHSELKNPHLGAPASENAPSRPPQGNIVKSRSTHHAAVAAPLKQA